MKRSQRLDRGVLRISGDDSRTFLQGLISNDINRADGTGAVYAALLTPQGKFLYDFFIVEHEGALLFDCLAADLAEFRKKLTMYKLRSKVELEDVSDAFEVHVLFGDDAPAEGQRVTDEGCIVFADPRLPEAGARAFVPAGVDASSLGGDQADEEAYQRHRIALGLPEAPQDLIKDKSILLESGFDELAGVDWKKGCYMGQELTARTKYRGLIKKRLVPVTISGDATAGVDIMSGGKTVGDLRSVAGDTGIALLRLDALKGGGTLEAEGATLSASIPPWMQLPQDEESEPGDSRDT